MLNNLSLLSAPKIENTQIKQENIYSLEQTCRISLIKMENGKLIDICEQKMITIDHLIGRKKKKNGKTISMPQNQKVHPNCDFAEFISQQELMKDQ